MFDYITYLGAATAKAFAVCQRPSISQGLARLPINTPFVTARPSAVADISDLFKNLVQGQKIVHINLQLKVNPRISATFRS